jgi:hypothetical protein
VAVSSAAGALRCALLLLLGGDRVAAVFTSDSDVGREIGSVLPLQAFGVLVMSGGAICWWALDGQGRNAAAAAIGALGGWGLNVPLAALSTFYFKWGLPGLVGSIGIGYSVMIAFSVALLLRSDWEALARLAVERAEAEELEEEGTTSGPSDSSGLGESSTSGSALGTSSGGGGSRGRDGGLGQGLLDGETP